MHRMVLLRDNPPLQAVVAVWETFITTPQETFDLIETHYDFAAFRLMTGLSDDVFDDAYEQAKLLKFISPNGQVDVSAQEYLRETINNELYPDRG